MTGRPIPGTWEVVTPATETSEGEEKRECTTCGYEETRTTPVLTHTHSWAEEWSYDADTHWHACGGCDVRDSESTHDYKDGVCTVCGYEDPNYEPGHEHSWDTQWKYDADGHWHECLNGCGEKGEYDVHNTAGADGACSVCGYKQPAQTVAVTGVTLSQTTASVTVGGTLTLTANIVPANATNKSVTWSSSVPAVATVSDGVVSALSAGSTVITVKTADGNHTATCTVTVSAAAVSVTGVTLNKTALTLTEGGEETLVAEVAPANATNKAVTWESGNPEVASVDQSGKVTAVKAGTATITVTTADGGKTASCTVTVNAATVAVTGVTLDKVSATMEIGDVLTLRPTVAPANATNKAVTWESGNPEVASVDQSGKVTALKAGETTVTVKTADGNKTAVCTITVNSEAVQPGGDPVANELVFDYDYFIANCGAAESTKTTQEVVVGIYTVAAGVYYQNSVSGMTGKVINTQGADNAFTFTVTGDTNAVYAVVKGASKDNTVLKSVVLKRVDPASGEVLQTITISEDLASGATVTINQKDLPAGTWILDAEKSVRVAQLKVTEYTAPHECTLTLVAERKEPTCTEAGNIAYWQCTDPECGKYYSDAEGKNEITLEDTVIGAKNHSASAAWSYDETGHWHVCLNGCGEKLDSGSHDTNGASGACSVCGYIQGHTHSAHAVNIEGACSEALTEYWLCDGCGTMFSDEGCTQVLTEDEIAKLSAHTLEHHVAVPATCTATGSVEYWYCTACDKYYLDEAAENETDMYSLETDALGHLLGGWQYDSISHYKTCSRCGAVDESTRGEHTLNAEDTCTTCGYHIDTSVIENIDSYGAYNESMYVVLKTDNAEGITAQYSVANANAWYDVPQEQIRVADGKVRADIVGVAEGTYDVKILIANKDVVLEDIAVGAYDRNGYAHFGYDKGIGAYDDDGTLKDGALVIYLTDENKNDITNSAYVYDEATNSYAKVSAADMQKYFHPSGTSCSIGYFLNNRNYTTVEGSLGGGIDNYGIKAACDDYGAVDIRVIGSVSAEVSGTMDSSIDGLTAYDSTANAGTVGDNGRMARIENAYNLTIEGIGEDAGIYGWGVHFIANDKGVGTDGTAWGESFEVRNITFEHYPEDAIGMEGKQEGSVITVPVQRCWIHNNVFMPGYASNPAESDKAEGDGSCDFKRGYYLTFDYNYLYGCHKTNLIGASDSTLQYNLTYHHNWWHNCGSRIPLTRQANVHFYNNYISVDADYEGEISYVMSPRANCYIFAEGNYFDGCKNIISGSGGTVKFYNNTFYACYDDIPSQTATRDEKVSSNCAYDGTSYSSFELNSSLFYDAEGLIATDSVTARKVVMENAGVNGFGYETAPGMNEVTPESALSIPEGGLTIDLSQVGKSTTVQYVSGVAFTNITGTSSGTVKGKGQLVTFTIQGGAMVTISCSGSGAAAGELIGADGTLYAGKINGSVTIELESGTYILASGIKDKELTISSISFEDTAASSQIRIDAAIAAINAIPDVVTLEAAEAVTAARFAYDALREDEAAQISSQPSSPSTTVSTRR